MLKLYQKAFESARKPDRIGVLITRKNGDFCAISVTERGCAAPISSDQHQFSPNNIHRLSSATSMRINQMITKRKTSDLLSVSSNLFCKEFIEISMENLFGDIGA